MPASITRTTYPNVIEVNDAAFVGGTGSYILGGAASGLLRFQDAFSVGARVTYTVRPQDPTNTKFERNAGGSMISTTSLGRAVVESSASGAAVNWLGGDLPLYIFCDSAADLVSRLREGEFGAARPADLPRGGSYVKDLGASLHQITYFDGTDEIARAEIDAAANAHRPAMTGPLQTASWVDAGAGVGPTLYLDRVSASPAVADGLGHLIFRGRDSANGIEDYAQIGASIVDPVSISEDGQLSLATKVGGAMTVGLVLDAGIQVGLPTGGGKGTGSVNLASGGYTNDHMFVDSAGILMPRSYTVATLPTPTARRLIYVADGAANKRLAVGDGTNFRFPDGNVVS
jgi:hypothetical protein